MSVGYHGIDLPALSTVASSQSKSVCVEDAEQAEILKGATTGPTPLIVASLQRRHLLVPSE